MLLNEIKESWDSLAPFRRKRDRCRDYTYGRQWNDIIEADGRRISEYEYILREGNVPLKNNLIRRIVRNVLGVFRERLPKILEEKYAGELKILAEENSLHEIYSRSMEEFLISGMVVHKKRIGYRDNLPGIWTETVSPDSFFFNTDSRDIRGWDISMAGEMHKVSFNEWCQAFVSTPAQYEEASKIFSDNHRKINVIEVWRKEMVPSYIYHDRIAGHLRRLPADSPAPENLSKFRRKWELKEMWHYYFLTDDGTVLLSGNSPYAHGSHPYVIQCYPFLDGEVQSFVADMIDQQRYTNRLITLYDWVIRASAKGVLLLPEGAVDPSNIQGVADQWGRFNGVIVYKADPNRPEPKQVNSNMSNLGISELLEIQLKMMEDVSGVNGVLQGNTSGGNVSGELYNSQTTNALYSLSDILETYTGFIDNCAAKDRMLLRQKGMSVKID